MGIEQKIKEATGLTETSPNHDHYLVLTCLSLFREEVKEKDKLLQECIIELRKKRKPWKFSSELTKLLEGK